MLTAVQHHPLIVLPNHSSYCAHPFPCDLVTAIVVLMMVCPIFAELTIECVCMFVLSKISYMYISVNTPCLEKKQEEIRGKERGTGRQEEREREREYNMFHYQSQSLSLYMISNILL